MKTPIQYTLLFLTAFLLFACSDGLSDSQKKSFIKFYGSYQSDVGRDVQLNHLGGYAITGSMMPDSISKMFLIITSEFGNQTANSPKYYGGDTLTVGNSLVALDDGYVLAGFIEDTLDNGHLHTDIYLVRTDAEGNKIWSRRFGGSANEVAYHIVERTTGGFVIAGKKEENGQDDLWILMVDEAGNKISEFTGNNTVDNDEARFILNTGSRYLVACAYNDGAFAGSGADMMVLVLDEDCNFSDARAMGTNNVDHPRSIVGFNDGYVVMGYTDLVSGDIQITVCSFSVEGDIIKNVNNNFATISGTGIDYIGEACAVSSNGDLAIAGSRESNENKDMLLQFVDTAGNNAGSVLIGELGSQSAYSIRPTPDGGLILVGSNGLEGNSVISLVKTDASGKF